MRRLIMSEKSAEADQHGDAGVTPDERQDGIPLWAVELGCWTMVALAPFLYWVNGPAVSTDQFVVRTTVVVLALVGGVAIRVFRWRQGKKVAAARSDTFEDITCDGQPSDNQDSIAPGTTESTDLVNPTS
ncbi:MAG: hypothetical protein JW829_12540 [Pirellulales bacterium]|nr:hypothetical protein [Pirellulales bacterium]